MSPPTAAITLSITNVGLTALMLAITTRAATGRLPRNHWIGIRTSATMRSDPAWMAGHRAAERLAKPLYLLNVTATLAALNVALLYAKTVHTVLLIGIGGFTAFTVIAVYAILVAARAARAADGDDDRPGR